MAKKPEPIEEPAHHPFTNFFMSCSLLLETLPEATQQTFFDAIQEWRRTDMPEEREAILRHLDNCFVTQEEEV